MINFLITLKFRNEPLFYFGLVCVLCPILFLCAAKSTQAQIASTNAWNKPIKFALSVGVFAWTMGWFSWDLQLPAQIKFYNWAVILLLGFEVFYIAFQAARGQLSHYNLSSPVYAALTGLMALAATGATVYTAYIGILFCAGTFPHLPDYYLLAIRLGIFLFVVFAFEGFAMGARAAHTVGGADGSEGIPLLNWSRKFGDLRIAHFAGMHALQVLPLLAFYVLKDVKLVWIAGLVYGAIALIILVQALNGKPLIR